MADRLSLRLAVYEPASTALAAVLPYPSSFTASMVHNKPGDSTLQVTVDKQVQGVEWLTRPCEIAVEANLGSLGSFRETPGGRFLLLGDNYDTNAKAGSAVSAQGPGIGWLFSKAYVAPDYDARLEDRPYRKFRKLTVGQIWNRLLYEAQTRGALRPIVKDWRNDRDSLGQPWGRHVSVSFDAGGTYLDALNAMVADGHCDVRFDGRLFRLFKPGTLTDGGQDVVLRGLDLLQVPVEDDRSNLATHALVVGDNNQYLGGVASEALDSTPWGRWETTLNISGVHWDQFESAGKRTLNLYASPRHTTTATLSLNPDGTLPLAGYQPGQRIGIAAADGQVATYDVTELRLGRESSGAATGALTLGHRKIIPEKRLADAVQTLAVAGTRAGGNGHIAHPSPTPAVYDLAALGAHNDDTDPDDDLVDHVTGAMNDHDILHVPRGTTLNLTRPVTLTKPGQVRGGGTIQVTGADAAIVIGPDAHGSRVENITLVGPQYDTIVGTSSAIRAIGQDPANRIRDLVVSDVTAFSWGYAAVHVEMGYNIKIDRVNAYNLGNVGITLQCVNVADVGRCRIVHVFKGGAAQCYGIAVTRRDAQSLADSPRSEDVTVWGCHVEDVPWEAIETHSGKNITFRDNTVRDCFIGIAAVASKQADGQENYAPLQISITGNTIEGIPNGGTNRQSGIKLVGAARTASNVIERATGVIANNRVRHMGLPQQGSTFAEAGIQIYTTAAVVVSGNLLEECSHHGIALYHTNHKTVIVNNTITDPWSDSTAAVSGIYSSSIDNDFSIAGNTLKRGSRSTPASGYICEFGVRVSNASSICRGLAGNDFHDARVAAYNAPAGSLTYEQLVPNTRGPFVVNTAVGSAYGLGASPPDPTGLATGAGGTPYARYLDLSALQSFVEALAAQHNQLLTELAEYKIIDRS